MTSRLRVALVGHSWTESRRWLGTALALAVLGVVFGYFGADTSAFAWLFNGYHLVVVAVALAALAAANAYRNGGLLVSVALAVVPLFGFALSGNVMGFFNEPTPLEYVGLAAALALFYGVPIGVVGYLVGVVGRSAGGVVRRIKA